MDDNDYGRKFCSRCDTYRGYVCAEHREPSYASLTARLAEAEAERDKYQKLNDIRWKESVMMTSEIGSLERRIAASELRCEKFQSQQAICQCGEPFSSHSEGSSCGMAVENQPPCPCQQRLAEAEAERKVARLAMEESVRLKDDYHARLAAAEAEIERLRNRPSMDEIVRKYFDEGEKDLFKAAGGGE